MRSPVSGHCATACWAARGRWRTPPNWFLIIRRARSVLFATSANAVDSPVTLEVVTERAVLSVRGDLTIAYADGRVESIPERMSRSGGRAYWGASHELLISDFYGRLDDEEPFWISPRRLRSHCGSLASCTRHVDTLRILRRDLTRPHRAVSGARGLGLQYLELRSAWDVNVLDLDADQLGTAKKTLAAHGLAVSSIGSPIGKISIDDDFGPHLERMRHAADVARFFDAPYIRIFSFFIRRRSRRPTAPRRGAPPDARTHRRGRAGRA